MLDGGDIEGRMLWQRIGQPRRGIVGLAGRAGICVLLISALVGCGSPTKQEEMTAAQHALVDEATALQRCYIDNGYSVEQCGSRRKAYESNLAAFRAKYGN
jgi:hypothetical protein